MADAADRNARWYLTGLAASLVGNSAMSLVAGVWIKSLTGSSAAAGLASACAYAPTLAAPLAGLVADRVSRRRWLIAVNLGGAAGLLSLLAVRSRAQVWLIDVAMAVYGVETVLADPAEVALFAELFSDDLRRRLNGLRLAIQETGRLVSPLLGAGLFVLVGGGAVAVLDAATFVVAALATTRLRVPRPTSPTPPAPTDSLRRSLAAGARHVWTTPAIRPVAVAATLVMAISGVDVGAQYSLVSALGERPAFLGVLSATLGASSVLASLSCGRVIAWLGERRVATIGIVDLAVGDLLRCVPSLPVVLVGTVVLGFALPYVFLAILGVSQRATPTALQGRVSAAISFALFGLIAPTQALGSLLIDHATYVEIYAGSAGACLAVASWLSATASRAAT